MSVRLRHLAETNPPTPEFDLLADDTEVVFLPLEAIWPSSGLDTSGRKRKDEADSGYTRFRSGDILTPKITPTFQADRTVLVDSIPGGVGAATTEVHVVRARPGTSARYLRYVLSSAPFLRGGTAEMIGVAGQKRVPDAWVRNFPIAITARREQERVADYLDTETARIDALITKKRRMIELLEERWRAYVQHAVSGGLSEALAFRETGDSMVPRLPEGWDLVRTRFLCDVETGASDTDESVEDGSYPFFVRSQTPQSSDRYLFDGEAMLTAGDGAGVGKVFHHFVGKFDAHQRVYVLHRFRRVSGRFFFYYFSVFFAIEALDGSAKSTVDSVRRHMITELPVALPPPAEQERLVTLLDAAQDRHEMFVSRLTHQIDLLVEHRQALITAAVTGELEVPGVAA